MLNLFQHPFRTMCCTVKDELLTDLVARLLSTLTCGLMDADPQGSEAKQVQHDGLCFYFRFLNRNRNRSVFPRTAGSNTSLP
ncbi:hypothetical protein SAMN05518866_104186 [Sphingobium sp. YR768]|nr:hypothetical protein SAMN05518866_104186 [Sphingobium sp. YR768]